MASKRLGFDDDGRRGAGEEITRAISKKRAGAAMYRPFCFADYFPPQGMMGTVEIAFLGEPSITRSE